MQPKADAGLQNSYSSDRDERWSFMEAIQEQAEEYLSESQNQRPS
jgi:hypothetical protein